MAFVNPESRQMMI